MCLTAPNHPGVARSIAAPVSTSLTPNPVSTDRYHHGISQYKLSVALPQTNRANVDSKMSFLFTSDSYGYEHMFLSCVALSTEYVPLRVLLLRQHGRIWSAPVYSVGFISGPLVHLSHFVRENKGLNLHLRSIIMVCYHIWVGFTNRTSRATATCQQNCQSSVPIGSGRQSGRGYVWICWQQLLAFLSE